MPKALKTKDTRKIKDLKTRYYEMSVRQNQKEVLK